MRDLKRIAILTYEGLSAFEFACALEIFALPRPEWAANDKDKSNDNNGYVCEALAVDNKTAASTGGVRISVKRSISALSEFGTLIVPSWTRDRANIPAKLAQGIKALSADGGRLVSICSGSFLLAYLGLLDGKQATTHWRYGEEFADRFPNVDYQADVLYTEDDNIYTSAGSSAGLDLCLHIVRQDFGYEKANHVARGLVMSPQRAGGQAQFIEQPVMKSHDRLGETLDWAIKQLDQGLTINDLAEKACLSRRSFDRQFRAAMSMSPKQWLIAQRINRASELLERGAMDMNQVAMQSGFESAMNLRHHFKRHKQISPSQFRNQFGQHSV